MRKFLISCLLFLAPLSFAQVTQLHEMKEVMTYFAEADHRTLAIFDIDLVLVQPGDPAFQMPNIKRHSHVIKGAMKELSEEELDLFVTFMILDGVVLIEEEMPLYLQELTARGIPTLALTASLTGTLAEVSDLVHFKKEALAELGIHFPHWQIEGISFSHFPSFRGSYPVYQEGFLFTNGSRCSKGKLLVDFLQKADLHPERIVFIDDLEKNLLDVEKALFAYDPTIAYEGIHYLGAHIYPSEEISEAAFQSKCSAISIQVSSLL